MGLAPSERHLEDWIVANVANFADDRHEPFIERIISRQLRLPSGVADLIALSETQLLVIELKRGVVDEAVLGQTLRYMADLKNIWIHAWHYGIERDGGDSYTYCFSQNANLVSGQSCEIGGIVVGHGSTKQSVVDGADRAGIEVMEYDFHDNTYAFRNRWFTMSERNQQVKKDFAYGALGEAMREVMRRRSVLLGEGK